ncbi:MAG TPA: OmpA family protein [Bacteroidia bacterium]|nr:OmpA family protein [Bacteroidia bacterium]
MKNILYIIAALPFMAIAQSNNLASNGSFEAITKKPSAPGLICKAIGMSSANKTTVDLFSKDAHDNMVKAPSTYMGYQEPSTGSNYAGIVAFYGDEGILNYEPGYDRYTEYLQVELTQPLTAGQTYNVGLKVALAAKSAYALSGLGIVMTNSKLEINNNSYLFMEPDMVSMNVLNDTTWSTIEGAYTAKGGEKYLTFGVFENYMVVGKIIPDNVNNSRKAYYFVDDISVTPGPVSEPKKDLTFNEGCFKLKNLNFELDKAVILPESFPELDALAVFLKNYPTLTIYIDGYADKTGTDNINVKLSADRANAVKSYLVNKGVNPDNLLSRWFGSQYPIDERYTNSATNRRVEITACCFK